MQTSSNLFTRYRMGGNVLDRFRLDGKVALVTGGSRGLGRVIADALGVGRGRSRDHGPPGRELPARGRSHRRDHRPEDARGSPPT